MTNDQRINRQLRQIHDSLHLLDQDNTHDDHHIKDKEYESHGKSSDEISFGMG